MNRTQLLLKLAEHQGRFYHNSMNGKTSLNGSIQTNEVGEAIVRLGGELEAEGLVETRVDGYASYTGVITRAGRAEAKKAQVG